MDGFETPNEPAPLRFPFEKTPEPAELVEVARGVFWVRLPLNFYLNHINVYMLDGGDHWVLVDTGIFTDDIVAIWQKIIATYCTDKPIKKVICTHMHPDHIGMAGWLTEQCGADFYMTRLEYLNARMLVNDTGHPAPPEGIQFFEQHAMGDAFIAAYKKMFGGFGRVVSRMPQRFMCLEEGQILTIGEDEWEIVIGNGHSPEHACLYNRAQKLLISGDQVLAGISSHIGTFPTEPESDNLKKWLESCQKIKDYVPNDVLVLPAHKDPFYGLHQRLDTLINNHEKGLARLLEMLATPRGANDAEIYSMLFRTKIDDRNRGMALSEVLSNLNCLIERKLVKRTQDEDGVLCYQALSG